MSRFSANKSSGNMSSILTQEAPPPLAAPPPRAGPGEFEKALLLQGTASQKPANGRDIHKGGISNGKSSSVRHRCTAFLFATEFRRK